MKSSNIRERYIDFSVFCPTYRSMVAHTNTSGGVITVVFYNVLGE